jgi:hypothetical protein
MEDLPPVPRFVYVTGREDASREKTCVVKMRGWDGQSAVDRGAGLEGRKIIIIRTAASLIGTEGSGRGRARTCCEARVSLRVSTAAAGNPRGTAR